jgi:hypothetical protein
MTVRDDHLNISVDARRPATLNDGAGKQTDFATMEEAVAAWRALPPVVAQRKVAVPVGRASTRGRSTLWQPFPELFEQRS